MDGLGYMGIPVCVAQRGRYTGMDGGVQQNFELRKDGKINTLTTVQKDNMVCTPIRVGTIESGAKHIDIDGRPYRVYSPEGKAVTICGNGGGAGAKTGLYACPTNWAGRMLPIYKVEDGQIEIEGTLYPIKLPDGYYIIRKLTVTECCRLQTLPDDYCRAVSATQGYRGLGNGWTAEVIIHILSHALRGVSRDKEIVVLSMYDGIGTGRYCFDRLGFTNVIYYAYEIDKYAIQIAMSNYPDIIQCGDAFSVREDGWTL
jgi:DNA (cytosine-5)-methyltransferase 3A